MIKVLMINHTFQEERYYKRWQILAEQHEDLDVYLLAPTTYEWGKNPSLTYGTSYVQKGRAVEEERFHIRLINIKTHRYASWTSADMLRNIEEIKPDIIYHIGEHTQDSLMQILDFRAKRLKNAKVIAFSMRGHQHALKRSKAGSSLSRRIKDEIIYYIKKKKVDKLNRSCDAIFCHYPAAVEEFRREGYKGPIYMQTQVGVDPDIFYPDESARIKIRRKYNIGDAYLFGSASRFNASKGLSEIIQALPTHGNWKYLMMGWGRDDEVDKIKKEISERGLEGKVILTGFINNWTDMAEHWNALDCAIHAPLTTPEWEETFSLALVQAMITGLPVIGSSSGSVPYQIGPDGIIVEEGNIDEMRKQMIRMMNNPEEGKAIGLKMRERALGCFSIYHLNELFYLTIKDIINGVYDEAKVDMTKFKTLR